jgi:hypothetical protein
LSGKTGSIPHPESSASAIDLPLTRVTAATLEAGQMIIESVELVALPNAPAYQEKFYRVHLDSGETLDIFQQHWDVNLPPETLVGLTVEEARRRRTEKMIAAACGCH